ncbi:MAG: hypothetical protein BWY65_02226 [Firmicutes bacterium ADurb.Bin373]|nr:MAG: hypothetical protein BWY65_02226 [Firmicutes bacterium ADurb.Bin373]
MLSQLVELFKGGLFPRYAVPGEPAPGDRSGPAQAAPAVDVDRHAERQRAVDIVKYGFHERPVRHVHVIYGETPDRDLNAPVPRERREGAIVGLEPPRTEVDLVFLEQVYHMPYAGIEQYAELFIAFRGFAVTRVKAGQEQAGNDPVGPVKGRGESPCLFRDCEYILYSYCHGSASC